MNKVIIMVLGKNSVGVIAKVRIHLAAGHINALDISQAIVQDYFRMMMIIDISAAEESLKELMDAMQKLGEGMGLRIHMQREKIFEAAHRI